MADLLSLPDPAAVRSPFPPIADYAFLSDCHTGVLIAPDGTVEWLCVPRFDSASLFSMLLDRGGGGFRIGPYGESHPVSRRYEPGTMVMETTWMTPHGWGVVRDALTIGPWHEEEHADIDQCSRRGIGTPAVAGFSG